MTTAEHAYLSTIDGDVLIIFAQLNHSFEFHCYNCCRFTFVVCLCLGDQCTTRVQRKQGSVYA
jgi:hypothetical protein